MVLCSVWTFDTTIIITIAEIPVHVEGNYSKPLTAAFATCLPDVAAFTISRESLQCTTTTTPRMRCSSPETPADPARLRT